MAVYKAQEFIDATLDNLIPEPEFIDLTVEEYPCIRYLIKKNKIKFVGSSDMVDIVQTDNLSPATPIDLINSSITPDAESNSDPVTFKFRAVQKTEQFTLFEKQRVGTKTIGGNRYAKDTVIKNVVSRKAKLITKATWKEMSTSLISANEEAPIDGQNNQLAGILHAAGADRTLGGLDSTTVIPWDGGLYDSTAATAANLKDPTHADNIAWQIIQAETAVRKKGFTKGFNTCFLTHDLLEIFRMYADRASTHNYTDDPSIIGDIYIPGMVKWKEIYFIPSNEITAKHMILFHTDAFFIAALDGFFMDMRTLEFAPLNWSTIIGMLTTYGFVYQQPRAIAVYTALG